MEKLGLPSEVFSNAPFSALDTGVEGFLFSGFRVIDVDRLTTSSGKFTVFPFLKLAADFTGF